LIDIKENPVSIIVMNKSIWLKLPSVTRPNKFFYNAGKGLKRVSVLQSFLTGLWNIQTVSGMVKEDFSTAKKAMQAAEKFI
jgi:hypothetical protein